ncbi:MAG: DUF1080 domain-containing protein [Bryobacteraceae bacterium]|jgi:hypothetical protein
MHRERFLAVCLLAAGFAYAQQPGGRQGAQPREIGPQPPVVDPGGPGKPPSDAVILFNGRDNTGWTVLDDSPVPARPGSYKDEGKPSKCTVADGVMTCRTGDGDVQTTEKFRNAQIHLEFSEPNPPDGQGWARGNSGAILLNRYEVQIVDSYQNDTGPGSEACGGFDAFGPLVNACRPPGEWQSYDIIFHAPACAADGSVQTPGSLTVLQNGVLVQDHVPVRGRNCVSEGPLVLQDHSRSVGRRVALSPGVNGPAPYTIMKFRNIWMRRLSQ